MMTREEKPQRYCEYFCFTQPMMKIMVIISFTIDGKNVLLIEFSWGPVRRVANLWTTFAFTCEQFRKFQKLQAEKRKVEFCPENFKTLAQRNVYGVILSRNQSNWKNNTEELCMTYLGAKGRLIIIPKNPQNFENTNFEARLQRWLDNCWHFVLGTIPVHITPITPASTQVWESLSGLSM